MAGAQPTRERARARVQGREASSLPLAAPPTLRHPLTPHPHSPPSPIQCAKQIQALHVAAAELRSLKPERVSALRARTGADGASTRPPHELSSLHPLTPPPPHPHHRDPSQSVYHRVGGAIFLRAPGKDAAAKRVAEETRRAEADLRREQDERRRQLEGGPGFGGFLP